MRLNIYTLVLIERTLIQMPHKNQIKTCYNFGGGVTSEVKT